MEYERTEWMNEKKNMRYTYLYIKVPKLLQIRFIFPIFNPTVFTRLMSLVRCVCLCVCATSELMDR